jgi:hypothetical protein
MNRILKLFIAGALAFSAFVVYADDVSTPPVAQTAAAAPAANPAQVQLPTQSPQPVAAPTAAVPTTPASQPTAPAPVANVGTVNAGQTYTLIELLNLGYAVETKGQTVAGGVAKAAAWRSANGADEFWQGVVQSDGRITIKEKMGAPKESKLLRQDWTGGAS